MAAKFPRPRFTLSLMMRAVVYCALMALCLRLYWRSQPVNQALNAWRQENGSLDPQTIASLDNGGDAVVTVLLQELMNGDISVQVNVLKTLGTVQADISPALPTMIEKLQHPNRRVRRAAAKALGSTGQMHNAAIDALMMAMRDDDESVRITSVEALYQTQLVFGSPRAHPKARVISAFAEALQDESPTLRCLAADKLSNLGAKARAAAPALVDALNDEDPEVVAAVLRALENVDSSASVAPQ